MDILKFLVSKHLLSKEQADQARAEMEISGDRAEDVLLAKHFIDEELLFQSKAEALNVLYKQINPDDVPLKVLELIPVDSAKYYRMVPVAKENGFLEIGMVYPEDMQAQEALQFLARGSSFSYRVALITPTMFDRLMRQYRNLQSEVKKALEELDEELKQQDKRAGGAPRGRASEEGDRIVEEAPVTKMVAVILRNAVEGDASDVHIEPLQDKVRVRFRFLGELHSSLFLPAKIQQAIVARIKILASMKIDETRIPQDGRFSTQVGGRSIDFRVATFPTPFGEKIAIRVLDPKSAFKDFVDLGISGANLERIKKASKRPFGLILVTGPTGSGKSTTLYAILRSLNKETVNIVSLEDPVEYFIEGVNQSQIHPDIGYDFASGLRQILRQDPNIIMVGEVRDNETAKLVIHAALTGHVVLSTLHTNNSVGVIPRLLDMGVDKYLIPATLVLALAQRLVRRLCDKCKEKKKPEPAIQTMIAREIADFPPSAQNTIPPQYQNIKPQDIETYHAIGCKECGSSGFSGRIAVVETLEITEEVSQLALGGAPEAKIAQKAQEQGMTTMRQDGMVKVLDGVTTIEEILRITAE